MLSSVSQKCLSILLFHPASNYIPIGCRSFLFNNCSFYFKCLCYNAVLLHASYFSSQSLLAVNPNNQSEATHVPGCHFGLKTLTLYYLNEYICRVLHTYFKVFVYLYRVLPFLKIFKIINKESLLNSFLQAIFEFQGIYWQLLDDRWLIILIVKIIFEHSLSFVKK